MTTKNPSDHRPRGSSRPVDDTTPQWYSSLYYLTTTTQQGVRMSFTGDKFTVQLTVEVDRPSKEDEVTDLVVDRFVQVPLPLPFHIKGLSAWRTLR